MRAELKRQLIGEEDKRKFVYQDHLGYWTIGIGRLVDKRKGGGLRDSEIDFMYNNDVDEIVGQITKKLPWFQDLDDARKGVLLGMAFQMGVEGLLGFHITLKLVRDGQYALAAHNMGLSLWARQTPERVARMQEQMRTGRWIYKPGK